jgi:hypothetical protein
MHAPFGRPPVLVLRDPAAPTRSEQDVRSARYLERILALHAVGIF